MAKELPFFRFYVSEWLNDDISFVDYKLQGIFASICANYWFRNCSITRAMLQQKFGNVSAEIEVLFEYDILKLEENDRVTIKFLDEQFDMLSDKRKKRAQAGRKGGLTKSSNATAKLKQKSSYKDKDKDKNKDKEEGSKIPSLLEVQEYFENNGYKTEVAEKAFNVYNTSLEANPRLKYWRDSKGNQIKNWKMKMQSVWFKEENLSTPKDSFNPDHAKQLYGGNQ